MKKVLSIDFDYFINATNEQRERLFPDGSDEVDTKTLKAMWDSSYKAFSTELNSIDVIDDYYFMQNFLGDKKCIFISDSHKKIKRMIDLIPKEEEIHLVNIDFHHDYYHYFNSGEEYNCGNWVRRLLEDRPDTDVVWVRREDSQVVSLEGQLPFFHTTKLKNIVGLETFDYIFVCKSPEWTPPHLYDKYYKMIEGGLNYVNR